MFDFVDSLVYRSKNKADWEKAQELLQRSNLNFRAWHSEEAPVGGCGSKLDIRQFGRKAPISKTVYKIEVEAKDKAEAQNILVGKVLPIRFTGVG